LRSTGFENDPQSERGSNCPRNRFGYTSYSELYRVEAAFCIRRGHELEQRVIDGKFDAGHLRKIHWFLFRDIFPWAGEFRVVMIAKPGGASFAPPVHIASALAEALEKLKQENYLRGFDRSAFAHRAAYYLGEINAIHPFREGNGRTQREFIRQLALSAGHPLSWAGFTQEQMVAASILSHTRGDNAELATIIETSMKQAAEPDSKD
jgi:cell filamentation protein